MRESVKKLQKSSMILQALREIFLHNLVVSFPHVLITVTHLYFCDKTRLAKVYISFMPNAQEATMIRELDNQKSKIRGFLGKRLAHKLRIIPALNFYLDTAMHATISDGSISKHL